MPIDRRQFVEACTSLGLTGVFPGVLYAEVVEDGASEITTDHVVAAENVLARSFTTEERDHLVENLNGLLDADEPLREADPPNEPAPDVTLTLRREGATGLEDSFEEREEKSSSGFGGSVPTGKPPSRKGVSDDTVVEIQFELFKQVGTFSLAAAGGAVTLLQTVFKEAEHRLVAFVAVGALVAAAIIALTGQQFLVERLGESSSSEQPVYLLSPVVPRTKTTERVLLSVSTALFGAGIGMFVAMATTFF